ncbi:Ig-like domain-containing protein [Paludibaculum fermentans]|uniref:Ig-like domain-containing protein n=1 Tax=Paludibaculum fermentans TaxID=1473598 RepID=A0A7S7SHF2_PALFE|nr:Ig-like domain-containing protein [Paludibaculum fermentans]QOY84894.1 Ig-like domain-containing protein [Paludibaculum fermentans]
MRLALSSLFLVSITLPGQSLPAFLASQYPAPGAVGVPRNIVILLRQLQVPGQSCGSLKLARAGAADEYLSGLGGDSDGKTWEQIFIPNAPLLPLTQYTAVAGCTPQSWTFQFTTGPDLDREGPRLVSVTPDPAARDTSPFGPFTLRFDQPLLKSQGVVSLASGVGNTVGAGSVSLTEDRQGIVIRPEFAYSIPPVIMMQFAPGSVRDLNNNPGAGTTTTIRFLTSLVTDAGGPRLLGIAPESGTTSVPTNSAVQLLFDRPIDYTSAQQGAILLEARGVSTPVQAEVFGALVRLNGVTLLPDTAYRVRVTTGLLDAQGVAVSQEMTSDFTTSSSADPEPTDSSRVSPRNLQVPRNARLVFHSARRLPAFVPLLVTAINQCASSGRSCPSWAVTSSLQDDGRTLVVTPKDPLPAWAKLNLNLPTTLDIAGFSIYSDLSFATTDQIDTDSPTLAASTPSEGDADVSTQGNLRFVLSEPVGLMTPANAVRLTRDGQAVPGQLVFGSAYYYSETTANLFEFTPDTALLPGTSYEIELVGVADLAGNIMPTRKIRFKTAADATAPAIYPRLVSTNLDSGAVGPMDPLTFEFNLPLASGASTATVTVTARQGDTNLAFPHPVRIESSGTTVRITPLLPWPAQRSIMLRIDVQDRWGRSTSYSNLFLAASAGDTDRPEVVSMSPANGTPLNPGQAIRITFSKPVLNASQVNGGLTASQVGSTWTPTILWSDDRTTATILPFYLYAGIPGSGLPMTLAVTSALVDLSGNPAKAFTARFPLNTLGVSVSRPSIAKSWPDRLANNVDVRSSLHLYLSGPVEADQLNRAAWIVTPDGRADGVWRVSGDGRLATFQPTQPWPAGSPIRLMQLEPVLTADYGYSFTTAAAVPDGLQVLRTSLLDPHPANAVIDIEFNQDIPAGRGPVRLQTGYPPFDFPADETRPRPNVVRLVPRSAPPVGTYIRLTSNPDSTLNWSSPSAVVRAALQTPPAQPLYRSPLPDSTGIAINARVSVVFTADVNSVSASEAGVTLTTGGVKLPATLVQTAPGPRLTLVPLSLLPANSKIDVAITGLEDRLGRAIPAITWSFTTGDSVDVTAPTLLYTNANWNLDPQVNAVLTFDKPLDPAGTEASASYSQAISWSLSSDLRTLYVMPAAGWKRGETYNLSPRVADWYGNSSSGTSVSFQAGFDSDGTALVLRAVSLLDGQKGLPLNSVFTLLFNKPLGSEDLRPVRLTTAGRDVPLAVKSASGNRVTLTPQYLLDPLTSYQLIVDGLRDSSGNALVGGKVISFVTGESLNEAATIAVYRLQSAGSPLSVRFSQPIDITPLLDDPQRLTVYDSGSTGSSLPVPAGITWTDDRMQLTITPRKPFVLGASYSLSLAGVTGSAGGSLSPLTFQFIPSESPDLTPAQLTFVPPDGSTAVPVNVQMQVTFSKLPLVMPAVRLYENGVLVPATLGSSYGNFTVSGLVTLSRALKPNQSYRIEVDGFRDALDNEIAASSATFTTGSGSEPAPLRLTSTSPANGDAGVSPDTPWSMTFNQPLLPFTFLEFAPQTSRAMPFALTTQVSGPVFTVTAAPSWPAASSISLILFTTTRFGLPTFSSWTGAILERQLTIGFKTAAVNDPTPPVLQSVEPPAGSTLPGGRATVTLRFSKPVALPGTALQIFYGATKASVTGTFSKDFRSVSFNLQPPPNSRVTIAGSSDIRDNADNPLEPFVLEYDTGENAVTGSPTAQLTEPARTWSVPADTQITVTFDRPMDPASVPTALRVTENGQNSAGSIEVLAGDRAYRFHPAAPFGPGSLVKVFLLGTAQDTNGLLFNPGSAWPISLSVEGVAPLSSSLELTRRGFLQTAPVDSLLEFELSAELDPSSVNAESVWLRRGARLVPGEVSLRDRSIVQFRPTQPLESGAQYVLTAGSALRSLEGRLFAGQDLAFRAAPAVASAELESVIETEWAGRRAVRVRFTAPVSPLAARGLSLDFDGVPVPAETLSTTDAREFLLLPGDPQAQGTLHLNLDRVPEANGRPLPFRRVSAGRGPSAQ